MKLTDTLILSLCVVIIIIGIHQTMQYGFEYSYWIFMFSIALLLFYKLRKINQSIASDSENDKKKDKR